MTNARDKANIPVLNFQSKGIDDNADATAVTIDSSESLGLGTTSPFNSRAGSFTISNEAPTIYMEDTNSSGSGVGQILYSNGDLAYSTGTRNGTGTSNSTEHFRIKNDGKVGIGTSSPDGILHLDDGATTKLIIEKDGGGAGSLIFHNDGSQTSYIQLDASENMVHYGGSGVEQHFYSNGSERMRIFSGGNVSIGTTSDPAKLTISNGSSSVSPHNLANELFIENNGDVGITLGSSTSGSANIMFGDSGDPNRGRIRYHQSNDLMEFGTAGGNEKLVITSSGFVGIGTTTPDGKVDIASAQTTSNKFSEPHLALTSTSQNNSGGFCGISYSSATLTNYGWTVGSTRSTGGDGSSHFTFRNHMNSASGNEYMRLDSGGRLGIGTTAPDSKLHVVNTSGQAAKIHSDTNNSGDLGMSVLAGLDTASSSGDCKWVRLADGNDSGKAYIQFKSSSPNAEFAAISDERLKTNIQDTDVVGLDVINNLRLVKFDWNDTATQNAGWSMTGHQKLGFVAQEVEQILPEFISEDTNGFKIMGDSGFVPYLIKAMQEQQTKIQELEARITTLETNNP